MNFIVFDLEATCWEGKPANMTQEIIEIGAINIDRYGEVQGVFSRFVRPILNQTLSLFCKQLTTIDQITVNKARPFDEVIEDFQEWAGIHDGEEYLLCSWGNFDKKMLVQDAELHRLETDWIEPYHLNIRRQYHDLKGYSTYKGLKKVVELEGFEFTGTYHRGISDAENLAKIFIKYIDEWRF